MGAGCATNLRAIVLFWIRCPEAVNVGCGSWVFLVVVGQGPFARKRGTLSVTSKQHKDGKLVAGLIRKVR